MLIVDNEDEPQRGHTSSGKWEKGSSTNKNKSEVGPNGDFLEKV